MSYTPDKPNKLWFTGLLSDRKISQRKLAAALGIDPAGVSMMLNGKRKVQLAEAEAIAKLLQVPVSEVLSNLGVDPMAGARDTALLAGWIDAQGEVHEGVSNGSKRVQAPAGLPERCFALRYQTAGTGSSVRDGWILFYNERDDVEPGLTGQLCVCQLRDGTRFVRAFTKGYKPGTYNLVGSMPGFTTLENVDMVSASPVLWMKTAV